MEYNNLTNEQKAKARACKTPEELVALAQAEGVELTDEQLEAVSGGWSSNVEPLCFTNDCSNNFGYY